ncbi:hypothetical protein BDD12DRAFT_938763 [Trichophaea hybrida]|nr:hypothetical protein BDD12DRAFT_938763 [Trichophaea hybrida]
MEKEKQRKRNKERETEKEKRRKRNKERETKKEKRRKRNKERETKKEKRRKRNKERETKKEKQRKRTKERERVHSQVHIPRHLTHEARSKLGHVSPLYLQAHLWQLFCTQSPSLRGHSKQGTHHHHIYLKARYINHYSYIGSYACTKLAF